MQGTYDMPVLKEVGNRIQKQAGGSLNDTVVLHINHCMDNSFYFSEVLNQMFCCVAFVGVPYNEMAIGGEWSFIRYYGKNKKDGFELWYEDDCFEHGLRDFIAATEHLIEAALEVSLRPYLEEGRRLLIFEDGGYHYPVLFRFLQRHPEFAGQVCGSVEQTASGTRRCLNFGRTYGYAYPCASISRSNIKMYIESRFISHRIVEELAGFLYTVNAFPDYHQVLILGYGILGRQIALELCSRQCRIRVYDTDPEISRIAESDGFSALSRIDAEIFKQDTIVIGNTGVSSFSDDMLAEFFAGDAARLYLASSSSQDWEFKDFLQMVRGDKPWPFGVTPETVVPCGGCTEYCFTYNGKRKQVFLIAEGLPVNFYRTGGISLTHSVIDLIFAEMLSMGVALHAGPGLEKKLWLLGSEDGAELFISEPELTRLWFSKYGLAAGGQTELLKGHPAGDYLRNKMSGGA